MKNLQPVSILMPICNEAGVIRQVVEEWHECVLSKLPVGSELFFDDCSVDGTPEILHDLGSLFPFLRVNRSARDGFFNSALRLYRLAKNDLLFFTDSDGQYVAEDFWAVHDHIDRYDMVHGYKADRRDPFYRTFGSLLFNLATRVCFRSGAIDVNSAFRIIRRPALAAVLDSVRHLRIMPNAEIYLRLEHLGYGIHNVPVRHRSRADGASRSLPLTDFLREGVRSLRGLYCLRRELAQDRSQVLPLPHATTMPPSVAEKRSAA